MEEQCNVDDILCQIRTLSNLKAIQADIGSESFQNRFPHLGSLCEAIQEDIASERGILREALAKCGNIDPEEDIVKIMEDVQAQEAEVNPEE